MILKPIEPPRLHDAPREPRVIALGDEEEPIGRGADDHLTIIAKIANIANIANIEFSGVPQVTRAFAVEGPAPPVTSAVPSNVGNVGSLGNAHR
jgi:hypothetical protein